MQWRLMGIIYHTAGEGGEDCAGASPACPAKAAGSPILRRPAEAALPRGKAMRHTSLPVLYVLLPTAAIASLAGCGVPAVLAWCLAALAVYACVRVLLADEYTRPQKALQIALVWLLPVFGIIAVLGMLAASRTPPRKRDTAFTPDYTIHTPPGGDGGGGGHGH
jgi:hypothetical protein